MAVAERITGATTFCLPVADRSAPGGGLIKCRRSFIVATRQSRAFVRARASKITEIPRLRCGTKRFVPVRVANAGSAVAAFNLSDEDVERGSQDLLLPEGSVGVASSEDRESILVDGEGTPPLNENQRWIIVKKKLSEIMSNAQKHSNGVRHIRYSLGVDLGDSRTGIAITMKGYAPRPLSVLQLKGDKLIDALLDIAFKERADEFIVGLPISVDGKETSQSTKTRSFAGKLAAQAAQRGWRVYLLNEYGSSQDGVGYMLDMGIRKKSRKEKVDAYAALVLLHSYFSSSGAHVKLIVPKGLSLQERLCRGDNSVVDDLNFDDF